MHYEACCGQTRWQTLVVYLPRLLCQQLRLKYGDHSAMQARIPLLASPRMLVTMSG